MARMRVRCSCDVPSECDETGSRTQRGLRLLLRDDSQRICNHSGGPSDEGLHAVQ